MKQIKLSEYQGRYLHIEGGDYPEGIFVLTRAVRELNPDIRSKLKIFGVRRGLLYVPREDLLRSVEAWSQERDITTFDDLMVLRPDGRVNPSDRARSCIQDDIRELSNLVQKWLSSKGLETLDKMERDEIEIIDDSQTPY